MKVTKHILVILVTLVVLIGCSSYTEEQVVFSEQLIYGDEQIIDLVQIDYKLENSKQWTDSSIINQLIEKLEGIELRQLTTEDENELFTQVEILYTIHLISQQSPSNGIDAQGGVAFILSTGEIVFSDIKTMGNGRTVSYINVNKENSRIEALTSYIEGL
ncbi:MAG: hypothetical protein SCK57_03190 [Bacillota bacterium]|nr:hypothetical protein [Bacillota bacterium]MDW7676644.1 hypothetical protein [Bacillota bacterium]